VTRTSNLGGKFAVHHGLCIRFDQDDKAPRAKHAGNFDQKPRIIFYLEINLSLKGIKEHMWLTPVCIDYKKRFVILRGGNKIFK